MSEDDMIDNTCSLTVTLAADVFITANWVWSISVKAFSKYCE